MQNEEIQRSLEIFETILGHNLDEELKDLIYSLSSEFKNNKPVLLYGETEENSWIVIRAWCYIYANLNSKGY